MGGTISTISDEYREVLSSLARFRRALRRSDQLTFDKIWTDVSKHLAAAGYAANATPLETFLLCIALEQQNEIDHLQVQLEAINGPSSSPFEEK